jgi:hypothetical protein
LNRHLIAGPYEFVLRRVFGVINSTPSQWQHGPMLPPCVHTRKRGPPARE